MQSQPRRRAAGEVSIGAVVVGMPPIERRSKPIVNRAARRWAECPVGTPHTWQTAQVKPVLDEVDRRLIAELAASPRLGALELSRRLHVARGTIQARLDKLQ